MIRTEVQGEVFEQLRPWLGYLWLMPEYLTLMPESNLLLKWEAAVTAQAIGCLLPVLET